MNIEIKEQLEKIEEQKLALLEQQKQLEKEAQYGKILQEYLNSINRTKEKAERSNNVIKRVFSELNSDETIGDLFELVENVRDEKPSSYYQEKINPVDQIESFPITSYHIQTRFGNIYEWDIENDKVKLPYSVSKQHRHYKIATVIKKFKEAIENEERKDQEATQLQEAQKSLVEKFSNLYPDAIVIAGKETIKVWDNWESVSTLKITFKNTSWVKLRIFKDGSYSIMKKFDHRTKDLKKDELIDYLSK